MPNVEVLRKVEILGTGFLGFYIFTCSGNFNNFTWYYVLDFYLGYFGKLVLGFPILSWP